MDPEFNNQQASSRNGDDEAEDENLYHQIRKQKKSHRMALAMITVYLGTFVPILFVNPDYNRTAKAFYSTKAEFFEIYVYILMTMSFYVV